MATVLADLIEPSLREIGVLAAGETPSAGDGADALAAMNRLLDQWAAERLVIYTITRTTWTITNGTQSYAVGSGAVVNAVRPVFVDHINFMDTSTNPDIELPMGSLTDDEYAAVFLKALTSVYPSRCYYNPTFPTGTISLFPIPTSTTLQGVLYAPTALVAFTGLSQTLTLPPAYARMLVKNLAMELAPSYEKTPNPLLVRQAAESMATVKRANIRLADLSFDAGALCGGRGRGFSIYSGS